MYGGNHVDKAIDTNAVNDENVVGNIDAATVVDAEATLSGSDSMVVHTAWVTGGATAPTAALSLLMDLTRCSGHC